MSCLGGVEGGDYSSAHVLDREDESIVAAWHGQIEPEAFGLELARLGKLYNNASIGVESNNHGLTTLTSLKNANYPRIFYHKSLELRGKGQERMGWRADPKTKPMMIDGIGTYLESKPPPDIPDRDLINELFGGDPWPYGVEKNYSNLERFIGYSFDQGLIDTRLTIDDLFVESTQPN